MDIRMFPEAFTEEWGEERKLIIQMQAHSMAEDVSEDLFIARVQKAIDAEMKKDEKQRRFVRLAREYLPRLEQMFKIGHKVGMVRHLLEYLLGESTIPMSEIDLRYKDVDGKYVPVDPYTGEVIPDGYADVPAALVGQDTLEAMALADKIHELLGEEPDMNEALPELELAAEDLAQEVEEEKGPKKTAAKIVYTENTSTVARLISEYTKMGYSAAQIAAAADVNSFDFVGPIDEYPDDDHDDVGCGAVTAMAEDQFSPEEANEAKRLMRGIVRFHQLIAEAQEILDANPLIENGRRVWYPEDAFKEIMRQKRRVEFFMGLIDENIHQLGGMKPQSVAVAALSDEELEKLAPEINLPIVGTLADFIDLFGDELIEESMGWSENNGLINTKLGLRPIGWTASSDLIDDVDPRLDDIVAHIEAEYIEKQFKDDPVRPDGKPDVENSRSFARGWFGGLALHTSSLSLCGWRNWRLEKSPAGARAYDIAFERERAAGKDWAEANKAGMRAFWNAGPIVGYNSDGVQIMIQAKNERSATINWNLALWKIEHGEIPLSVVDRQRLKGLLQQRGFTNNKLYRSL